MLLVTGVQARPFQVSVTRLAPGHAARHRSGAAQPNSDGTVPAAWLAWPAGATGGATAVQRPPE